MVQISIPKEYVNSRKFIAIPVHEYAAFLRMQRWQAHDHHSQTPRIFTKRTLIKVSEELVAAHPDNPQLVADVLAGLKRSSVYAKHPTAAR